MNDASKRPSWDRYFMDLAEVASRRSNCSRRRVAAVIVRDHRVISTGYNGTPCGVRNCFDGGCPRCASNVPSGTAISECLCRHGEENAIVQAARYGIAVQGAVLYTTYSPCLQCAKMIINAGISEVIYHRRYTIDDVSLALLREAGVRVRPLDPADLDEEEEKEGDHHAC